MSEKIQNQNIKCHTKGILFDGISALPILNPTNPKESAIMKKIYLAGPYSHPQKTVRNTRFKILNRLAADLMNLGYIVYSPISHSHPIAVQNNLPLDHEYWQKANREFIRWCDAVVVVEMDGWDISKGVADEISFSREINKPVYLVGVGGSYETLR